MTRRADLAAMRLLRKLQLAERTLAANDLADANAAEVAAEHSLDDAKTMSASAARRWFAHLDMRHFQPELGGALGRQLLDREREVHGQSQLLDRAKAFREDREELWHQAQGQLRAVDQLIDHMSRKIAKRAAERLLDHATINFTSHWRQE